MLGDKPGDFLHILSGNDDLEIVGAGNKTQRLDLPETAETFGNPVVPEVPLRADLQFNNGGDLPVDNGGIALDDPCGFKSLYPACNLRGCEIGHGRNFFFREPAVLLKNAEDFKVFFNISPEPGLEPLGFHLGYVKVLESVQTRILEYHFADLAGI